MRPAQKAPENEPVGNAQITADRASMRPAQKAPENARGQAAAPRKRICFNEAGAKSAGKRKSRRSRRPWVSCFNEAGAKSAGKPPGWRSGSTARDRASMRPAQKAPENRSADPLLHRGQQASMRPAQKAPENFRASSIPFSIGWSLQ